MEKWMPANAMHVNDGKKRWLHRDDDTIKLYTKLGTYMTPSTVPSSTVFRRLRLCWSKSVPPTCRQRIHVRMRTPTQWIKNETIKDDGISGQQQWQFIMREVFKLFFHLCAVCTCRYPLTSSALARTPTKWWRWQPNRLGWCCTDNGAGSASNAERHGQPPSTIRWCREDPRCSRATDRAMLWWLNKSGENCSKLQNGSERRVEWVLIVVNVLWIIDIT